MFRNAGELRLLGSVSRGTEPMVLRSKKIIDKKNER